MTDDTARIELRRKGQPSLWALVDAEDLPRLRDRSWHVLIRSHTMYAQTSVQQSYRRFSLLLHRYVLDAPSHLYVDHINGDGLDNRKANLRLADYLQSSKNRRARPGAKSPYKGVAQEGSKWRARISRNGERIGLGLFATDVEAAQAYDLWAFLLDGEFAKLNFPEDYGLGRELRAA